MPHKQKFAVGSVAQEAVKGSDSLLQAARDDINEINRGPFEETLLSTPDRSTPMPAQAESEVAADTDAEDLEIPVSVLASVWFSENSEPPKQEEVEPFEDALAEAVVEDEPAFEFNDKVYSIDKASKMEITEENDSEREGFFFGGFLRRNIKKMNKKKRSKNRFRSPIMKALYGKSKRKTNTPESAKLVNYGNFLSRRFPKATRREINKRSRGVFNKLSKLLAQRNNQNQTPTESALGLGSRNKFKKSRKRNEAQNKYLSMFGPVGTTAASIADGDLNKSADPKMNAAKYLFKRRTPFAEGGDMPIDTYPNIPPQDMEAVKASQLPDDQMEDKYEEFILDEALNENDQGYLMSALEQDSKLSTIFDRVMDVATEFSGAGAVKGIGTGTSDSIPARLSDGEFVFTAKAVKQIGSDNLQMLMDDAEREFDKANGIEVGSMAEENTSEADVGNDNISEELESAMMQSNEMPKQA
jgi:hypothetical protein